MAIRSSRCFDIGTSSNDQKFPRKLIKHITCLFGFKLGEMKLVILLGEYVRGETPKMLRPRFIDVGLEYWIGAAGATVVIRVSFFLCG